MSFFAMWAVTFYAVPFLLVAAMPGWRSFGIAALVGTVALAILWADHHRNQFGTAGDGAGAALGEQAFGMLTASIAAAIIGRANSLAWQDRLGGWRSTAVVAGCFLAPLIWFSRAIF